MRGITIQRLISSNFKKNTPFESIIFKVKFLAFAKRSRGINSVFIQTFSLVIGFRKRLSQIKINFFIGKFKLSKGFYNSCRKLIIITIKIAHFHLTIGIIQVGLCLRTTIKPINIFKKSSA